MAQLSSARAARSSSNQRPARRTACLEPIHVQAQRGDTPAPAPARAADLLAPMAWAPTVDIQEAPWTTP